MEDLIWFCNKGFSCLDFKTRLHAPTCIYMCTHWLANVVSLVIKYIWMNLLNKKNV